MNPKETQIQKHLRAQLPLDAKFGPYVDIAARDAIPTRDRYPLMTIGVLDSDGSGTNAKYHLKGGITNNDWEIETIDHDYSIIYLSKSGSDINDGTVSFPVLTLQKAVDLAVPNSKSITIVGEFIEDPGTVTNIPVHPNPSGNYTLTIRTQDVGYGSLLGDSVELKTVSITNNRVFFINLQISILDIIQSGIGLYDNVSIRLDRTKVDAITETIEQSSSAVINAYNSSSIFGNGIIDTHILLIKSSLFIFAASTIRSLSTQFGSSIVVNGSDIHEIETLVMDSGYIEIESGGNLEVSTNFTHIGVVFVNKALINVTGTENFTTGKFADMGVSADGSVDTHSDVDIVTTPPTNGQGLIWQTNKFIPGNVSSSLAINTYYIANTGNDTTGNGSSQLPYLTAQKAHNVATSGDEIVLMSGYSNSSTLAITKDINISGISRLETISGNITISGFEVHLKNLVVSGTIIGATSIVIGTNVSLFGVLTLQELVVYAGSWVNTHTGNFEILQVRAGSYSYGNTDPVITSHFVIHSSKVSSGLNSSGALSSEIINSWIDGDIVHAGDIDQLNSTVNGTITTSGTITNENQLRKRATPTISANVLDIDFKDKFDYKTIAEIAAITDFAITVSNDTNADVATIGLFITNTVIITLPSGSLMEDSETRWVGTPTFELTIEGGTGKSFELSLNKVGSKYKWIMSQKFI